MTTEHDPVLPLLTPAQAAEQIGMSGEWIRKQAQRGTVPHHRLGQSTRFCVTCLEEIARLTYRPADEGRGGDQTISDDKPKAASRAAAKRYQRRPRHIRPA